MANLLLAAEVSLLIRDEPQQSPREPIRDGSQHSPRSAAIIASEREHMAHEQHRIDRATTVSYIMAAVIVCNALQMGAESQFKPQYHPMLKPIYRWLDIAFNVCYVSEVSFGLWTQGQRYFCEAWNVADFVITIFGVVDLVTLGGKHSMVSASRSFRLLRMIRLLRVVKVMKAVPDLVIVLEGLVRSMQACSWVILLMTCMIYMFAVLLVNTVDEDLDFSNSNQSHHFEDLTHAMMTLVDMAILDEWGDIVNPIMEHQPILLPIFFFFTIITSFGMMNVMIGVIVDSTARAKENFERQANLERVNRASEIWKRLIHEGGLSQEDIEATKDGVEHEAKRNKRLKCIHDVCALILEDENGIPFPERMKAHDVLELLDFDADGELSHDEFTTGLIRILEADTFQLTCLTLTMIGKIRQDRRVAEEHDKSRWDQVFDKLSVLTDKVDALSVKVNASQ